MADPRAYLRVPRVTTSSPVCGQMFRSRMVVKGPEHRRAQIRAPALPPERDASAGHQQAQPLRDVSEAMDQLIAILTYQSMDSSYPGPSKPRTTPQSRDAVSKTNQHSAQPLSTSQYHAGLRTPAQRMFEWRDKRAALRALYTVSEGVPQRSAGTAEDTRRRKRREDLTIAQIMERSLASSPGPSSTPLLRDSHSTHRPFPIGKQQRVPSLAASVTSESTVRAIIRGAFDSQGVALDPGLEDSLAWMVSLGCLDGASNSGSASPFAEADSIISATGPQADHTGSTQAHSSLPHRQRHLGAVLSWMAALPDLKLIPQLPSNYHLLIRTPSQLDASLSTLRVLLGPDIGMMAETLVARDPHLLWKSPSDLIRDLEDLMDTTRASPVMLTEAVAIQPSILSHHTAPALMRRWSHLTACVIPSLPWSSQLASLSGAGWAAVLSASHSVIDGLQYMQERGQDNQYSLVEALELSRKGLGRKFRRWRQRHLSLGQWYTLHDTTCAAEDNTALEAAALARLCVETYAAEMQVRRQSEQETEQDSVIRQSLHILQRYPTTN